MDDPGDGPAPSALEVSADGEAAGASPAGPAADAPQGALERYALRIRLAELAAVVDTIAAALGDARRAGCAVTPRHARLAAEAEAAARLLGRVSRRLR